jgi:hypothetical protein
MIAPAVRQCTTSDVIAEVADAARALHTTVESWRSLTPSSGALTDAQICVEGIRRRLADLSVAMKPTAKTTPQLLHY